MEPRERENVLQDRGALPKEEGDVIREFKATQDENFLSSWLKEDGKNKEGKIREVDKETTEETGQKRMREEEKGENETVLRLSSGRDLGESWWWSV